MSFLLRTFLPGLLTLQQNLGAGESSANLRNQLLQFSRDQSRISSNIEMFRILDVVETTTDVLQTAPTVRPGAESAVRPPLHRGRKLLNPLQSQEGEDPPERIRRNFEETFLWVEVDIEHPL